MQKCSGTVNKKVIFCQNCKLWFHKKCELPDNPTKFNKLKNAVNPIYICKACSNNLNVQDHPEQNPNPLDSLPFADENTLDDIFGSSNDIQNPPDEPEDIEEDLYYKIFQTRGLHFVHINANSML